MVSNKHCCYGTCNSDSRYAEKPHMKGVFFLPFPKPVTQGEKCDRWARLCGRVGFDRSKVNRNTYICSKHFVGGNEPTNEHPDPLPATAVPEQVEKLNRKRKAPTPRAAPISKKEKNEAAMALLDLSFTSMADDLSTGSASSDFQLEDGVSDNGHLADAIDYASQEPKDTARDCFRCQNRPQMRDQGTQTIYDKYTLGAKVEEIVMKNEQALKDTEIAPANKNGHCKSNPILSLDAVKNSERKMRFFTGLTYLHFLTLFRSKNSNDGKNDEEDSTPVRAKRGPSSTISKMEELFLTLLRLRRGYSFYALSHFCGISETQYRVIFTTWLQLLYCHFKDLKEVMFPPRQQLKKFIPRTFQSFKNIRCVVDCTEFFVQMPRNFARQGNLFSNYKHHCTFKALIAVAPNGTCVFVSDLFEGAVSDKDLFERCGIIDYLNPGDLVLADRGFTIREFLQSKLVELNIPPFLNGRDRLTPQEELLTRRIAKARIHIERFNERVKKFKLISGTIPLSLAPLANQAVFVACCLVNFQDELVK